MSIRISTVGNFSAGNSLGFASYRNSVWPFVMQEAPPFYTKFTSRMWGGGTRSSSDEYGSTTETFAYDVTAEFLRVPMVKYIVGVAHSPPHVDVGRLRDPAEVEWNGSEFVGVYYEGDCVIRMFRNPIYGQTSAESFHLPYLGRDYIEILCRKVHDMGVIGTGTVEYTEDPESNYTYDIPGTLIANGVSWGWNYLEENPDHPLPGDTPDFLSIGYGTFHLPVAEITNWHDLRGTYAKSLSDLEYVEAGGYSFGSGPYGWDTNTVVHNISVKIE